MTIERELALRLAWYGTKYGPIPYKEMVRLFRVARGLGSSDADRELKALAEQIIDHFR